MRFYEGEATVEGIRAVLAHNRNEIETALDKRLIPVLVDPQAEIVKEIKPFALIDAILAKKKYRHPNG
jgi:xanthine dehydrogenase accessory factor